jgi:putative ABC transport system permease protein
MAIMIRTKEAPLAMAPVVRGELRAFDRNLPVGAISTMENFLHDSVGRPRFNALVLGAFSSLALVLAVVGIYGVISHAVAQRTKEIGIRAALGAEPADVMRLVLGRSTVVTAVGIGTGLVGALALTGLLRKLLFDVTPTDAGTFAVIAILLAGASLVASYLPARRALRIDPLTALRQD